MGGKKYEFIGVVETTRACMRKNNGWLMEVKNDARLFFSPFFFLGKKIKALKNIGRILCNVWILQVFTEVDV